MINLTDLIDNNLTDQADDRIIIWVNVTNNFCSIDNYNWDGYEPIMCRIEEDYVPKELVPYMSIKNDEGYQTIDIDWEKAGTFYYSYFKDWRNRELPVLRYDKEHLDEMIEDARERIDIKLDNAENAKDYPSIKHSKPRFVSLK